MVYGAHAAQKQETFTLEEMLKFAIQDEYLAREEYEIAINTFGDEKPFPSIINSEVIHINWLKELFTKYAFEIPSDESKKFLEIPKDFSDALQGGIQAEIDNIAMYEGFLLEILPEDITLVFTKLRDASKGHLFVLQKKTQEAK